MWGNAKNQPSFAGSRHSPQGKQGKPSQPFSSSSLPHPTRQQPPEQLLATSPLPTSHSHGGGRAKLAEPMVPSDPSPAGVGWGGGGGGLGAVRDSSVPPSCSRQDPGIAQLSRRQEARWEAVVAAGG